MIGKKSKRKKRKKRERARLRELKRGKATIVKTDGVTKTMVDGSQEIDYNWHQDSRFNADGQSTKLATTKIRQPPPGFYAVFHLCHC